MKKVLSLLKRNVLFYEHPFYTVTKFWDDQIPIGTTFFKYESNKSSFCFVILTLNKSQTENELVSYFAKFNIQF